jgi:cell division protein ZapA
MAIVQIRVGTREYNVACDDGQEEQLRVLADEVDDRVRALTRAMGASPGESMSLLLTALTLADEVIENKKETEKVSSEVQRLALLVNDDQKLEQEDRMVEIENAMAVTLEEIAMRIEKIARQIEIS